MIPLILLALGLGVALTAYELSPRTRARVDVYARAIRTAHASQQAADASLGNASAATAAAARHAQQAEAAAQAAQQAAAAAQAAQAAQRPPVSPAPTPPPTPPSPAQPAQVVADAQASAAQAAADAAAEHVADAQVANQDAAKNIAEAAKNAATEQEKQAAAQSAAKVLETEKKIADELAKLGVGQCGARTYTRVTEQIKNALLAKLRAEGMGVVGDNPWNIDTRQYSVRLRAIWDPKAQLVKLIVTTGKGTTVIPLLKSVTCQDIWDKINPIMKGVGAILRVGT